MQQNTRYYWPNHHRPGSMFHSWNQAFRIRGFLGWRPDINLAWRWEHEGWLIWPYLSHFSAVFSNQQLQLYHRWWICEALIRLFLWKWSSRWILSSAVLLWFIDTILFNVWRSLSLSFGFWPLFLLADDVLPRSVYVAITMETAVLYTPNKVVILVTDAPAKRAPTICPLWKSDKSPILQYLLIFDILIYLLTAIWLTPGGSSTVQYSTHLHSNNTQNNTINNFGLKAIWDSNPKWSK